MILATIFGILLLALAGFLAFAVVWGHIFVNWKGESFWTTLKESFPRILIIPVLAGIGFLFLFVGLL